MQDRITVVGQICHQQSDVEATGVEIRHVRACKVSAQEYKRIGLKVGEEWQPLVPDGCWIDKAGQVIVVNEGERFRTNPTKEQLDALAARVFEIATVSSREEFVWLIPPTETFNGYPSDFNKLMIRCQKGVGRYTVVVYPD